MGIIKKMTTKPAGHPGSCGCNGAQAPSEKTEKTEKTAVITKDMIVRDVAARWPQTVNVFGNHKVDFCCGGAHSIEQTARARGCQDIESLLADLNRAVQEPSAAATR